MPRQLTMGCFCGKEAVDIDGRRFFVRQRLGEGGFSYVDMVEETRTHKLFALKRIGCHSKDDEKTALREVEYMNSVRHPNLIPLETHALVPLKVRGPALNQSAISEVLIVMPYYWRGGLQDQLEAFARKRHHMPEPDLLRVFRGICLAVRALHTARPTPLAHRDLKPHNVMYQEDETPILMDFGSMGPARTEIKTSAEARRMQDYASERCSMPYRAPELFNVESLCTIDERTDIWSLGCLLYAMCFHESPFDKVYQRGDSIALAAMAGKINIPSDSPYSSELKDVMMSMLAVDPLARADINTILQRVDSLLARPDANRI